MLFRLTSKIIENHFLNVIALFAVNVNPSEGITHKNLSRVGANCKSPES